MDIFRKVRERVDILEVCDLLGIKLNRNYKTICPFEGHREKTPSFSVSKSKNIFCCFGCGKKGDSITLVHEILNISLLESAKYLNATLHLGLDLKAPTSHYEVNRYKERRKIEEAFKKWELKTFLLLTDYLRLLKEWKEIKDIENELYIESLQQIEYTEYVVDLFLNGTNEDKIWFWKYEKRWMKEIESRVRTFRTINE